MLRLNTSGGIIIIILQHKFEFPGPQNKSRSPGCKLWQFWILGEKAVAQANILAIQSSASAYKIAVSIKNKSPIRGIMLV